MFKRFSVMATLVLGTLATQTAAGGIMEPVEPEVAVTQQAEQSRVSYTPPVPPVKVPSNIKVEFERAKITSKPAPPKPKPKPKPVELKEEVKTSEKPDSSTAEQITASTPKSSATGNTQKKAPATPAPTVKVSPGSSQAEAQRQMASYGWGADQLSCLVNLWEKESNWNHTAMNPTSGAYGIPQSLPGDKMATAGADWQTNPATQIKWGLGYIDERYGSPCNAWGHSQSVGWY